MEEFDLSLISAEDLTKKSDCEVIAFWVPKSYKAKYDMIQSKSNRRFGKYLKKLFMTSIDKIKLDEAS